MKFEFINPKHVFPEGWLKRQLEIQADGLFGNLDRIWPDVKDSKWIGGDREGWERLPYFLDGFIPLALLCRNDDKITRAKKYADCILSCQDGEGRFRPKNDTDIQNEDLWSQFLIMKMLTTYADCLCDDDKKAQIENALYNCLKFIYRYTDTNGLKNWAASRWYECLVPITWLIKRNPLKKDRLFLQKVSERLKVQGMNIYECVRIWKNNLDENKGWNYETHVVNASMSLKSLELYGEVTGQKPEVTADEAFTVLYKKHGTAYGHFTGDECLSGLSAVQGSELCGIVEAMYSYEWLSAITGKSVWGDRLENLAFNGLPATISEDMKSHQYVQQVNQISCKKYDKPIYRTNQTEANVFGLEPNYGCCTANFGQGFPKFALSAYMKQPGGIVAVSPVPITIRTIIDGDAVNFSCKGEYPFGNRCVFTSDKTIKLKIRAPKCAKIEVYADEKEKIPYLKRNGWITFNLIKDVETTVIYLFSPRIEKSPEGGYRLVYGPLLFAVPIKENRQTVEYESYGVVRKYPYCDYYLTPESEWRYAFIKDEKLVVEKHPFDAPFSRSNPPVTIRTKLSKVKWNYEKGYDLIASKTPGKLRDGNDETINLQPYGATDLRIAVMSLLCDNKN